MQLKGGLIMKKGDMVFERISMSLVVMFFLCGFSVLRVSAGVVYFSDDFESGLGNWSVSGSDWAVIDTDSVSPNHSVTDSPDDNFVPNANASLTLALPIDLSLARMFFSICAPILLPPVRCSITDSMMWTPAV